MTSITVSFNLVPVSKAIFLLRVSFRIPKQMTFLFVVTFQCFMVAIKQSPRRFLSRVVKNETLQKSGKSISRKSF